LGRAAASSSIGSTCSRTSVSPRRRSPDLDLFLDIWVAPNGTIAIEDEDEVADHARRSLLSKAQQRHIARTRERIVRDHRRIIREAERLLADLRL